MQGLDLNYIIFCSFVLQIPFQKQEFFSDIFLVFYMIFFDYVVCFIRFSKFSVNSFFWDMTCRHIKSYI